MIPIGTHRHTLPAHQSPSTHHKNRRIQCSAPSLSPHYNLHRIQFLLYSLRSLSGELDSITHFLVIFPRSIAETICLSLGGFVVLVSPFLQTVLMTVPSSRFLYPSSITFSSKYTVHGTTAWELTIHGTRSYANPGISLGTEVIVYEGIPYVHEKGATRTMECEWSVNDCFASIVLHMVPRERNSLDPIRQV